METENRIRNVGAFPKVVYLQALAIFLGANFMYHHQVFRTSGNRLQFLMFMGVNLFTSYQIADATVTASLHRQATMLNNAIELKHRQDLQHKLRIGLFNQVHQ